MKNNLWSIYRKPENIIEGSELHDMISRFPQAANHDKLNYIFVTTHPDAQNPIIVNELRDENGDELSGDALIIALSKIMFSEDRAAIHLSKSKARFLHNHPIWRLWCGNYEEKDSLESDHEAVFKAGVDRQKSIETLNTENRDKLRATLS